MSTSTDTYTRRGMARQMGEFLTRNIDNRALGWPRRTLPRSGVPGAPARGDSLAGMRVLVVGDLSLEYRIEVAATRAQVLDSLRAEAPDKDLRGIPSEPAVGGLVARASRAAAALGARVSVCSTVPVPIPARFERFLDECAVDRRYITGLPVPCPVTAIFQCEDGRVVVGHRRTLPIAGTNLPEAVGRDFDAILIDPRRLRDVDSPVHAVSRSLSRSSDRLRVGLRVDRRSGHDAISLANDNRVWTFVRRRDAAYLARQGGTCVGEKVDSLVRCLHDRQGIARLVLLRGPRGAVLMNGIPCPYRVQTCPLVEAHGPGAGDTLLAVTTLSSAAGADDRTSVRRGVAAATGKVAGLPLPKSFEELDAA